jgi:DNA helicase-2/ATP-dependent DNA helicase PcrA
VGLTRAKQRLVLTHTCRREMHGRDLSTIPSDFLNEMPLEWRDCTRNSISDEFLDYAMDEIAGPELAETSRTAFARSAAPRLTTAAALAAGVNNAVSLPVGFTVGMTVRHPQYGVGTVVEVSPGFSRHRTLTVEFPEDRRETFVAGKCPLQPVGVR